ncbi:MAG: PilZ domain-containing protein [Nitrospirales bacterium]|nr:PilZ domain-containing protein [Nitrospirales bacterium]
MTEKEGERRKEPRLSGAAAFEYALHGECIKTFRPGEAVDAGSSGMGVITDCALEPGQVIIVKSGKDPSTPRIAVVQWSMKSGDRYRAGLQFLY